MLERGTDMDKDQVIALLQREYRERGEKEAWQKQLDMYDPKKRIAYTLEQLIDGIKSGKQYIYFLKLLFETREVLDGQWKIPYILDFFDVENQEKEFLQLFSSRQNVNLSAMSIPVEQIQLPNDGWISRSVKALNTYNLKIKVVKTQSINQLDYFCYEMPTKDGFVYNVQFRIIKKEHICVGNYNCMLEDKDGKGLLMEAMVCVMEEWNR